MNSKKFTKTPNQIIISKDGVYVDDMFLDNQIIEDIADGMMRFNEKMAKVEEPKESAFKTEPVMLMPVPEIVDVDHEYIAPLTIDLNGKVSKNVPVSHIATKDEIEVVPNGIIYEESFIPLKLLGEASRIGMNMLNTMNGFRKLNQD